ncbi:hypothetical protein BDQ17DRAFT_1422633 [Cyathus striatus]|nr:hypothetical protein BDQ17DRAFT_1422633 [Cyathus striatus]
MSSLPQPLPLSLPLASSPPPFSSIPPMSPLLPPTRPPFASSSISPNLPIYRYQFSDLALWLGYGHYGRDHIPNVIAVLGLSEASCNVQPNPLSFSGVLPFAPPSDPDTLDPLASQLHTLRNIHSFTIKLRGKPFALNFLIGQLADGSDTWGGLVGIAVWSDD